MWNGMRELTRPWHADSVSYVKESVSRYKERVEPKQLTGPSTKPTSGVLFPPEVMQLYLPSVAA